MAKCANDCNGEAGADMKWFKTHEWGYDASAVLWASQKLAGSVTTLNALGEPVKPYHSFKLPTSLQKGNYLVRVNIIGQ
jgi:hypothetical protein